MSLPYFSYSSGIMYDADETELETIKRGSSYITVRSDSMGRRIERLISTDPNDYLKNDLLPGRIYHN